MAAKDNFVTSALADVAFDLNRLQNPVPFKVMDDSQVLSLPVPVSYSCNLKEYVGSNAGRTEDLRYNKMLLGTYVELAVSYGSMSSQQLQRLLQELETEYLILYYFDPRKNAYETEEFYISEKSLPMYSAALNLWSGFSVTFTQRKPDPLHLNEGEVESGAVIEESEDEVITESTETETETGTGEGGETSTDDGTTV